MIHIDLDLSAILELNQTLKPKLDKALQDAARDVSIQAHAKIVELAQQHLHSSRKKYIDALSIKQENENTWIIALDKKALWIEEGMEEHSMVEDLLKSRKTKTAKDGSRYLAVPFEHKKGQTEQTPYQKSLTDTIKSEMKKRNIPYGNIEMGQDGKPKLGLLHKFDVMKKPIKTAEGVGQGKGPIGEVKQGSTGVPFLQGVRVYQKMVEDKTGKLHPQKSIMTFRVVSSKHKGSGKWIYPKKDGKLFFEQAEEWVKREWETKIKDLVLEKFYQNL
jgi:hypothetical protein